MHFSVRGLSYRYGQRTILRNVDVDFQKGAVVGILGRNGAGKSTLLRLLSGIYALQEGQIVLDGQLVAGPGSCVAPWMRQCTGVVFQEGCLDTRLSAIANLRLYARLYGEKCRLRDDELKERLDAVALGDRVYESVKNFSGGMRRKLELVRALLHAPDILLLDEPSAGLDEAAFRAFWADLSRQRQHRDLSIVVMTHRLEEAELCDRLLVIHGGKIVADGTPDALRALVPGDRVELHLQKNDHYLETLRSEFPELSFHITPHGMFVVTDNGHRLVPRLVEALPDGAVDAVFVRKPSLAEAFLKITGEALDGVV